MSTYKTGTVSVTNGNAVITGSGTAWSVALVAGGIFSSAGVAVPIASVTSDTSITLDYPWPGTTASGSSYSIAMESSSAASVVSLQTTLSRVLVTLSLAGITPNSSGSLTDRAALTLGMPDKGYLFLRAEIGVAFAFYRWNGTSWDGPFAVQGPAGLSAPGSSGYRYVWNTSTTSADPGTGNLCVNNATLSAATALYISETTDQAQVISAYMATWTSSTSTAKGTLRIIKDTDPSTFAIYGITGTLTDNGTWDSLTLVYLAGSGSFVSGDKLRLEFVRTGDLGATGATGATGAAGVVQSIVAGSNVTVNNTDPANPIVSATGVPMATAIHGATGKTTPVDADEMGIADSGASFGLAKLTWANLKATLKSYFDTLYSSTSLARREVLTANRTYYVGFNMGAATVSIASPGVVTKATHGLIADSRVSFSILPNTKTATVSVATPAVVTMANTFAAGQPVVFSSTGRLPKGLVAGTTYYVIATGLSGSSFQVSATVGGAAINTSNPTFTVTIAAPGVVTETAHGRATGDAIQLATTGALPTGLVAATTYFLNVIDANTYNLRLTPEGANITTTGTQSGTHTIVQFGTHYLSETGVLPTGITAGQDYFVIATGLTTNTFQFAATSGGATINTSGSTSGTIVLKTGSDSNTGLVSSAGGALLTIQKAVDTVASLDMSIYQVTIQVGDATYTGAVTLKTYVGALAPIVQGNNGTPANVIVSTTSADCFKNDGGGAWQVRDMELRTTTTGHCLYVLGYGNISFQNIRFGTCAAFHVFAFGGRASATGNYSIVGSAQYHLAASVACVGYAGGAVSSVITITLVGIPAFSGAFALAGRSGTVDAYNSVYSGAATGSRYNAQGNGVIFTNGGGASFFPGNAVGTLTTGGQYL